MFDLLFLYICTPLSFLSSENLAYIYIYIYVCICICIIITIIKNKVLENINRTNTEPNQKHNYNDNNLLIERSWNLIINHGYHNCILCRKTTKISKQPLQFSYHSKALVRLAFYFRLNYSNEPSPLILIKNIYIIIIIPFFLLNVNSYHIIMITNKNKKKK